MLKVLTDGCKPKRATKLSAAIDLFAAEDVVIGAGETAKIPLGVCIDIDFNEIFTEWNNYTYLMQEDKKEEFLQSHYLQLEPRSSLRAKGLIAGTGIIDLDYKDEIMMIIHKPVSYDQVEFCACQEASWDGGDREAPEDYQTFIKKGEKIAQIMLCEHKSYLMGYESETERSGGFGHSGDR